MGAALPQLAPQEFGARLARCVTSGLDPRLVKALYAHYRELARWNPRLSLVGPGTAKELVERHYGESLAALPLLPAAAGRLLDIGSGAGFPGWVLAAARPDWRVILAEAQGRKATFLRTAARRAGVTLEVVDVRIGRILPESLPHHLDRITVRAVRLDPEELAAVAGRLAEAGEVLFWAGRMDPAVPPGWRRSEERPLGGEARRLLAYRPQTGARAAR